MDLVEKLIAEPTDDIFDLLLADDKEVFWVDWRDDDAVLADYCEAVAHTGMLGSHWVDDVLTITYAERSRAVPLTQSPGDRHITLMTINELMAPDYSIRMVWESEGSDTLAFSVLPEARWAELEAQYGSAAVDRTFLTLTHDINPFIDALHVRRPTGKERRWWTFWR